MSDGNAVQALFEHFTQLRLSGFGRQDAWNQIVDKARDLPRGDQKQLNGLLQHWEQQANRPELENSNGRRQQPTQPIPDVSNGWDQHTGQPKPEIANGWDQHADEHRRRNLIRRIQPADRDQGIVCPQCHKMNQDNAAHCYSCGTPLGSAVLVNATRPLMGTEADNAYFGDGMALFLKIQGAGETLRLKPSSSAETILGRKAVDSVMVPDVDLSPFQAEQYGVSRLHASLRRQDDTLVLMDLGSKNYTHINGQRLHAHEVRVLHDGDELRLGRLVMYAYFSEG